MAKDALSHLTSRGVSGAEKQNSFPSHYLEIKPVQDLKFVTKDRSSCYDVALHDANKYSLILRR